MFGGEVILNEILLLLGIMAGLLVNGVFVSRFFGSHGGASGSADEVNQSLIGQKTP